MKAICPACKHEFHGELNALIPESQRLRMELKKSEEGGSLFSAKTIGGAITGMEKCLLATARQCDESVHVFISDIQITEGAASIEFVIARVKRTKGKGR